MKTCRSGSGANYRTRLLMSFAASGTLLIASCSESTVPVHPVAGMVTFENRPPSGALVVLHPQGATLPQDLIPTGIVQPDGTFQIGTYDSGDGAPAGTYKATFQWFKVVSGAGGSGRGPNVLPAAYADPRQTPVEIVVGEGPNDLPPVVIRR